MHLPVTYRMSLGIARPQTGIARPLTGSRWTHRWTHRCQQMDTDGHTEGRHYRREGIAANTNLHRPGQAGKQEIWVMHQANLPGIVTRPKCSMCSLNPKCSKLLGQFAPAIYADITLTMNKVAVSLEEMGIYQKYVLP